MKCVMKTVCVCVCVYVFFFSLFETAELGERRVRLDGSLFEGSKVTEA